MVGKTKLLPSMSNMTNQVSLGLLKNLQGNMTVCGLLLINKTKSESFLQLKLNNLKKSRKRNLSPQLLQNSLVF